MMGIFVHLKLEAFSVFFNQPDFRFRHSVLFQERASKKGHLDRFQANHCHHAILYEQVSSLILIS